MKKNEKKEKEVTKNDKLKLTIYFIISTVSFLFLVLVSNAHISVAIFFLIQIVAILYILPKHKGQLMLIPIGIISLNFLLSDNVWYLSNYVLLLVLYLAMILVMTTGLDINNNLFGFLKRILGFIIYPFNNASYIRENKEENTEKKKNMERILKGLIISIPFIIILLGMLSSADMVFSKTVGDFFANIFDYINITLLFRIGYSVVVGLYLFGLMYSYYKPKKENIELEETKKERKMKDPFVLNIVLGMTLIIYTIFIIIQFRYLFAKGVLPFDLTYAEYARKGFFELLFLTALNIGLIVFNTHNNKDIMDNSTKLNKGLLYYLCTVTIILLVSSFYRMNLYSIDFGLTRLRFYVFGFLIFEAFALLITYFYIYKPKFNIILVYSLIGLIYYLVLAIVPTDRLIAKNQIDRYLNDQKLDISYVINELSLDAAPEVIRLIDDEKYGDSVTYYFKERFVYNKDTNIREYSLSYYNAKKIYENNKSIINNKF